MVLAINSSKMKVTANTTNNNRPTRTSNIEPKSEYLNERYNNQQREIMKQCTGDERQSAKRNDLIREQQHKGRDEWRMRENSPESPEMDIDFNSEDRAKKLQQTIEQSDRKTLREWYEYTFSLKDLIGYVEEEAKKCGCTAMYEPILDSKQRISHGFNAISKKLRSNRSLVKEQQII